MAGRSSSHGCLQVVLLDGPRRQRLAVEGARHQHIDSCNPAKRSAGRSEALVTEAEEWVHRDEMLERPERRDLVARSEEHTSELQSLMRNSYAVFCLKKKKT